MGAVHVLPGTTQSSPKDKGEYDSADKASMTLDESEIWLHLEICRFHNTRHSGLRRTPLAAWANLGGDDADRQVVNTDAFRISFLPSQRRQLGRTGINLFSIGYWSDAFAPMIGRGARPLQSTSSKPAKSGSRMMRYNPGNRSGPNIAGPFGASRNRRFSEPQTSAEVSATVSG